MDPKSEDALRHEIADCLRGIVNSAAELGNREVFCLNIFRFIANHDDFLSIPLKDVYWPTKITDV